MPSVGVKERITFCSRCQNLTDVDPCSLCSDPRRDQSQICVVEEPLDVLTLERTGLFRGLYHVLHGVLSPMNGVGPEELRLKELSARIENGTVNEIIIATNPTLEGEATGHVYPPSYRSQRSQSDPSGPRSACRRRLWSTLTSLPLAAPSRAEGKYKPWPGPGPTAARQSS